MTPARFHDVLVEALMVGTDGSAYAREICEDEAAAVMAALPDEWNPDKMQERITELIEQRDKEGSE